MIRLRVRNVLDLLTDKGVYPYDYMKSSDQLDDEQLPSKEDFYSQLSEEGISDNDYEKAKVIWKHFNTKNIGEHHDLYLKTDVLLMTDFIEILEMYVWKITDWTLLITIHYLTLLLMLCLT